MSWLLDTNVLSELRKGSRCNARVASWFAGVDDDAIFLSVLVLGEIRRGIERLRPRDPRGAQALERWLGGLERDHGERILPIDRRIGAEWGRITAAASVPAIDGLLAATARVFGLTLATRNVKHVRATGVPCFDPFV